MQRQTDQHRKRDLDEAGENGLGILLKDGRDHEAEDREHDGEREEEDGEEKNPRPLGDNSTGNVSDGLPFVTERDDKGAHIVNGTNENRTKDNPDEGRNPAPYDSERGANDGSCAGDGGEVVPEDDLSVARDEVDTVFKFDGWNDGGGVQFEELASEPLAVSMVSHEVEHKSSSSDEESAHWV